MDINQTDKPISELISSVEPTVIEQAPKKEKNYSFLIVVTILLVLITAMGGYYVYNEYFVEEVEEENTQLTLEEEPKIDEVSIDLGDEKYLTFTLETSECDDTGFLQIKKEEDYAIWEDNGNEVCSSSFILSYFKNREVMDSNLALSTDPILEKIMVDNVEYEYIYKEAGEESSEGLAYKWLPEVNVKEYKAFKILSYYNMSGLAELNEDSNITSYCGFDISQFGSDLEGYVIFRGSASIGSNINYCDILNNMDSFKVNLVL